MPEKAYRNRADMGQYAADKLLLEILKDTYKTAETPNALGRVRN